MKDPAVLVLDTLRRAGQTVATAESLTGGLIGALLTAVPGASASYRGGVIVYATDLKHALVGVREETLSRHSAVAAETAGEMATGVRDRCAADWGLAVTGVAGPDPQDGHPVGQVFVAVAAAAYLSVRELTLTGNRATIRQDTATRALSFLIDCVEDVRSGRSAV